MAMRFMILSFSAERLIKRPFDVILDDLEFAVLLSKLEKPTVLELLDIDDHSLQLSDLVVNAPNGFILCVGSAAVDSG